MRIPRIVWPAIIALIAIIAVACSSDGDGGTATLVDEPTAAPRITQEPPTPFPTPVPGALLTTVEIVRKLEPSVVQVLTEDAGRNVFGQVVPRSGVGTGAIIDADGFIITNNHVIRVGGNPTGPIASRITVTLFDGRTARAEVVGSDPATDLAVLHINETGLVAADLGDASGLPVGSDGVAIGFALNLEGGPTVTRGVISAIRTIQQPSINIALPNALQTDASINPGNSGGPLVDDRGRVVGINTSIIALAQNIPVQNIGFAIPVGLFRPIAQELIQNGEVRRGFLGIDFLDVTPGLAASLGLPAEEGVSIARVLPGTPADDAELQPDDVIIGLGEIDVRNSGDLLEALRRHKAGDEVIVRFYRGGDPQEAELTLTERSDN